MSLNARAYPALILNKDLSPLSYYPLSLCSWQDSVRAVVLGRVAILAHYDVCANSPNLKLRLPSVVRLRTYSNIKMPPSFTRFNVFLRDLFSCQYCGKRFAAHDLTFDHVVARAHGGQTSWDNIVTACHACNNRKGDKLPHIAGMFPITPPFAPTNGQLRSNGWRFPHHHLHQSWRDYLYWDSKLEP